MLQKVVKSMDKTVDNGLDYQWISNCVSVYSQESAYEQPPEPFKVDRSLIHI